MNNKVRFNELTQLYEITIAGKLYTSENAHHFYVDQSALLNSDIKLFPTNVSFEFLTDSGLYEAEYLQNKKISIEREVRLWDKLQEENISTIFYLTLLGELIQEEKDMKAKFYYTWEDPILYDDHSRLSLNMNLHYTIILETKSLFNAMIISDSFLYKIENRLNQTIKLQCAELRKSLGLGVHNPRRNRAMRKLFKDVSL